MHRSRLSTLLIDTPADEAGRSATFWAAALGAPTEAAEEPEFTVLHEAVPGLVTAVQAIDSGQPRYHVDIETDDVDAEVARLVALGATEESAWQGCRTLRAPGGHLLCIIPLHSDLDEFARRARTWP